MRRKLIAALLCVVPMAVLAEDVDDDSYGKWEVTTEMKMSGPGGDNNFSSKATECRSTDFIEENSSEWTMNNCRSQTRSGKGKSRSSVRCEGENGNYEETITEASADTRAFQQVTSTTSVSGGEKSIIVTTVRGRRIGDCDG